MVQQYIQWWVSGDSPHQPRDDVRRLVLSAGRRLQLPELRGHVSCHVSVNRIPGETIPLFLREFSAEKTSLVQTDGFKLGGGNAKSLRYEKNR